MLEPEMLEPEMLEPEIAQAEERLLGTVASIGPMVIAFSGGVDSALVVSAAKRALPPESVLVVTADSESLASGELERCRQFAHQWDVSWCSVATDELADSRYQANNGDRCYWCKSALMDQLEPFATDRAATIVLGVNLDDLADHRPGQQAAKERGARFPLVEAEFSKAQVRALAKAWELPVWDRPAMPCLSSRIPYGTEVSIALLSRIDRAEASLRGLGFGDVRVRHYGATARIELPKSDMAKAIEQASAINEAVQRAGYDYVTLDLAGLSSGNLNRDLANPEDPKHEPRT